MQTFAYDTNGGRLARGVVAIALIVLAAWPAAALAQAVSTTGPSTSSGSRNTIVGFSSQAVGGISIDAQGIVSNVELADLKHFRKARAAAAGQIPQALNDPAPLRKISLRKLEAAIAKHVKDKTPLTEDLLFLAGLQQIRYVFVFPEQHDIVLAGFGEGWRVDDVGNVVGLTTGHPVLHLDDLLVALRSAMTAAQGGISCSIDPTQAGLNRLQAFMAQQTTIGDDPAATISGIEQSLGPQQVTVTGVPDNTHSRQVLVAADYRMKRLAMNFDKSPVRGMPSYLTMIGTKGSTMPRWWLAPDYDPLLKDADGLSFEIQGSRVKTETEDDFLSSNGQRQHSGQASPGAQKWAANMTKHYEELSLRLPIFAELHSLMDMAVVAALITKERLTEKADCQLPLLMDGKQLTVAQFDAPRVIDSKASFVKKGDNWIISASGGVLLNSWEIADRTTVDNKQAMAPVRAKAAAGESKDSSSWWWN